ncbi:hypothetical protein NC651_014637 [Populus alba x Populus x berolinensis]|nr:hypothetical protein NC651_014637 [Populus alba x Populus x berolinensis]
MYEHGCVVSTKIEEEEEDVYSWRLPGTNNYFGTQIGARAMDLQICRGKGTLRYRSPLSSSAQLNPKALRAAAVKKREEKPSLMP